MFISIFIRKLMKVYFTRKLPTTAFNTLKANNIQYNFYRHDRAISKEELIPKIKNISALGCLLTDKIDKDIIDAMPKCKIIANYGAGFNNIDVEYAISTKGIIVTNTRDVLTEATADLTLALILSCARRIFEANRFLIDGKFTGWKPELLRGYSLKEKTAGIIGVGRIGTAVAQRLIAFGCKILYTANQPNRLLDSTDKAEKVVLDELLSKSDIISIHVPLKESTYQLLNKKRLNMLKKTAILINTARGEVIDELHLIKMLKNNRIFAAGLDVFQNEPEINPEFFKLNNVVALPHIGSATYEVRDEMAKNVAENIVCVLNNKKPITPIIL